MSSKQVHINLMLNLGAPSKQESSRPPRKQRSCLIDNIKSAICMCESDEDSAKEWEYIQAVSEALNSKQDLSKKQKELLQLIEPFLKKHNSANGGSTHHSSENSSENGSLFKL